MDKLHVTIPKEDLDALKAKLEALDKRLLSTIGKKELTEALQIMNERILNNVKTK